MIALLMAQQITETNALGSRLRRLRLARGMSQSDLSMASKVPQTTIHKIETGTTVAPRVDTLSLIAEALKVTVRELMEGDEPINIAGDDWETRDIAQLAPNTPVQEARELLANWDHLTANGRRSVQALIDGLLRLENEDNKAEGKALEG